MEQHCAQCGSPFVATRAYPPRRYCSPKCRQAYNNAKVDPEKHRRQARESHARNREKANARRRQWSLDNPERTKSSLRQWYRDNKDYANAKSRQWYLDNRERAIAMSHEVYRKLSLEEVAAQSKRQEKRARELYPWMKLVVAARKRALQKGVPFSLTHEWARERWTGLCELTELPFDLTMSGKAGPRSRSPTIDRIVPSKGYTPDNCRFLLHAVNSAKNTGTDADLYEVATQLLLVKAKLEHNL
jgi:hypothetical protein